MIRYCFDAGYWSEIQFSGCTLRSDVSQPFLILSFSIESQQRIELPNTNIILSEVKAQIEFSHVHVHVHVHVYVIVLSLYVIVRYNIGPIFL